MKLHHHFILNFLSVFTGTILLAALVSYFNLKDINTEQYKDNLRNQVNLIKIELNDIKNLDKFAKEIKENLGTRFTLIDDDGVVLVESHHDIQDMDNHGERQEVRIARAEDEGFAVRHSDTVDIDFLYIASAFYLHQKPVYIRLAIPLKSVREQFFSLWTRIIAIFSITILLGAIVAYKLSDKIRVEIEKITTTLDEISNKNYKAIVNAGFSTEFHKIETHIKKLSSKLEKREKQKRKYTAKIRLISKQRSDIISAISHEFKNPIASVMGYAQTLLDEPNANEHIRTRFLQKIVKNSEKISYMIDRLSLATKFENGDLTPLMSKFDLRDLCQDVISTFKDKHKDRNFELRCESYFINADKTMIDMVIVNLIDNALKYSEGKISLILENKTLHVKDEGIGITHSELEKVTNKFYRSNTLSWDNSIGLGLAIVKHILNLHETTLEIKSEVNVGSDFYFKI